MPPSLIVLCVLNVIIFTTIFFFIEIIAIILACLIRVFNSLGFAVQALFATEFYPTCVRSLGPGFLFTMVRIINNNNNNNNNRVY
jgi:hypothetical protein